MKFTIEEIKLIKIFGFELDTKSEHYRKYNECRNYDYLIKFNDEFCLECYSLDYDEQYGCIEDMDKVFSTSKLKDFLIETYGTEPLIEHRKSKLERIVNE